MMQTEEGLPGENKRDGGGEGRGDPLVGTAWDKGSPSTGIWRCRHSWGDGNTGLLCKHRSGPVQHSIE